MESTHSNVEMLHQNLGMMREPARHFQPMLVRTVFLGRKVRRAALATSPGNVAWKPFFTFKAKKALCVSHNIKGRSFKSFDT